MSKPNDAVQLARMVHFARLTLTAKQSVTHDQYEKDLLVRHGLAKLLELFLEAAYYLSKEWKQANNGIDWKELAIRRRQLVHEYFELHPTVVWDVVDHQLGGWIEYIEPLFQDEFPA